jgi:hypothetical protein
MKCFLEAFSREVCGCIRMVWFVFHILYSGQDFEEHTKVTRVESAHIMLKPELQKSCNVQYTVVK